MQFLSHSKVAKAELYLIGGYHNEWLELTYYIETLAFWANCKKPIPTMLPTDAKLWKCSFGF